MSPHTLELIFLGLLIAATVTITWFAGYVVYKLYKVRHDLTVDDTTAILVGFAAAFVSGLFVVRSLLAFVSRRGYAPFAFWRIIVGALGLVGLYYMP